MELLHTLITKIVCFHAKKKYLSSWRNEKVLECLLDFIDTN